MVRKGTESFLVFRFEKNGNKDIYGGKDAYTFINNEPINNKQ